jgi:hypothetical protein
MWTRLAALTPLFVLVAGGFFAGGLVTDDVVVVTGGGTVVVVVGVVAVVVVVTATLAGAHDTEPVTGSTVAGTRWSASYGGSLSWPLTRS